MAKVLVTRSTEPVFKFCDAVLNRHGPFVAFYFYCKIMLYGIDYTCYSIKTVKICLGVENRRSKGAYLCIHIDHESFSKPL